MQPGATQQLIRPSVSHIHSNPCRMQQYILLHVTHVMYPAVAGMLSSADVPRRRPCPPLACLLLPLLLLPLLLHLLARQLLLLPLQPGAQGIARWEGRRAGRGCAVLQEHVGRCQAGDVVELR